MDVRIYVDVDEMETKVKFPVGSIVSVVNLAANPFNVLGQKGVVHENFVDGEYTWNAVRFRDWDEGHTCGGLFESHCGWWILDEDLELVQE